MYDIGRVSKVLLVTSFSSGSDGVVIESERLLYLAQLEVEESLVPVKVEAEVLSLAPVVLSVGQERGALPRPAGLLEVVSEGVVGPVVQGLVVQGQSSTQLSSLGKHRI